MGNDKCIRHFGWKNLEERDHLGDLGIDGRRRLLKEYCMRLSKGFNWLTIGCIGGLL
jgi:hypothetical protein